MATERLSMRKLREILRQKWALARSHRHVAASLQVSVGTVTSVLRRANHAGLDWAQVQALHDEILEARLYGAPATPGTIRPLPDCAYLHAERKKPGVTLELLHLEYREQHPGGYRSPGSVISTASGSPGTISRCGRSPAPARRSSSTTPARKPRLAAAGRHFDYARGEQKDHAERQRGTPGRLGGTGPRDPVRRRNRRCRRWARRDPQSHGRILAKTLWDGQAEASSRSRPGGGSASRWGRHRRSRDVPIRWPCVDDFSQVVTHLRVFSPPTAFEAALGDLESFFRSPRSEAGRKGTSIKVKDFLLRAVAHRAYCDDIAPGATHENSRFASGSLPGATSRLSRCSVSSLKEWRENLLYFYGRPDLVRGVHSRFRRRAESGRCRWRRRSADPPASCGSSVHAVGSYRFAPDATREKWWATFPIPWAISRMSVSV
jgi:hypothetical protein